MSTLEIMLL